MKKKRKKENVANGVALVILLVNHFICSVCLFLLSLTLGCKEKKILNKAKFMYLSFFFSKSFQFSSAPQTWLTAAARLSASGGTLIINRKN